MLADPQTDHQQDGQQGEGSGDRKLRRGREGQEHPQQVHAQDQAEQAEDKREVFAPLVADDGIGHTVDHAEHLFAGGLQTPGNDLGTGCDQLQEQHDHHEGDRHRQMRVRKRDLLLAQQRQRHLAELDERDDLELLDRISHASVFFVLIERNRLRLLSACLRHGHHALCGPPGHPNRNREAQKDPANQTPRIGLEIPVHSGAERQTHEDTAKQVGDNPPRLTGRRLSRRLVRNLACGTRLQRGCAFGEAFDRLFARFRGQGHGLCVSDPGPATHGFAGRDRGLNSARNL